MPDKIKRVVKSKILLPIVIIFSLCFLGWGNIGHSIINFNTILTALPEMVFFETWADSLSAHASDADYRRSIDPDEGPKHYIDIDNYPEFLSTGTIPQNFDSLVAIHGYPFVIGQGILPWAILNTTDSLQAAFENNNFNKAMLLAADLGHYIADSHMPLHITRNYNGQYTGQSGVHSRYESSLIQRFQNQITYDGDSLEYIANLPAYIFNMVYNNYLYVDSVLAADAAAKAYAGNTQDNVYYDKFWELSKNFTIELFKKASYKLTCVIYTAWINAGETVNINNENHNDLPLTFNLFQNYPNPFNPSTKISWQSSIGSWQTLKIYDILGNEVTTLIDEYKPSGSYEVDLTLAGTLRTTSLSSGIYFYRLQAGDYIETKKMLLLK